MQKNKFSSAFKKFIQTQHYAGFTDYGLLLTVTKSSLNRLLNANLNHICKELKP